MKGDKERWVHVCEGTILETNLILTYAWCVWDSAKGTFKDSSELAVNGGDFKWPTTDEKNTAQSGGKIKCIHFHSDYKKRPSRSYTNQLAIVELENDFKETDYVAPIRVCTKKDKVNQTHVLKSAGMEFEQVPADKLDTYHTFTGVAPNWEGTKARIKCKGVIVTGRWLVTTALCLYSYGSFYPVSGLYALTRKSSSAPIAKSLNKGISDTSEYKVTIPTALRYHKAFKGGRIYSGDLAILEFNTELFSGKDHVPYCNSTSYDKNRYTVKFVRERNDKIEHITLTKTSCSTNGHYNSDRNVCFKTHNFCPNPSDYGGPAYLVDSDGNLECLYSVFTWMDEKFCDSRGSVTHAAVGRYNPYSNFFARETFYNHHKKTCKKKGISCNREENPPDCCPNTSCAWDPLLERVLCRAREGTNMWRGSELGGNKSSKCKGVIVTGRWLVTTALCLYSYGSFYPVSGLYALTRKSSSAPIAKSLNKGISDTSEYKVTIPTALRYHKAFKGGRIYSGDLAILEFNTELFSGKDHVPYCNSTSYDKNRYTVKFVRERNDKIEHITLTKTSCSTNGHYNSDRNVCFKTHNFCPTPSDYGGPAYLVDSDGNLECLYSVFTWMDEKFCDSRGSVTHAAVGRYNPYSNFFARETFYNRHKKTCKKKGISCNREENPPDCCPNTSCAWDPLLERVLCRAREGTNMW
ncbi:uncharacterized protein LOC142346106 [Convolutriloba macropyga]|uniref:uncharacterized protein LOC142346106 n=1 Tax=Convolutriloba macropyga TaxID=536237 RepID=UPI003F524A99